MTETKKSELDEFGGEPVETIPDDTKRNVAAWRQRLDRNESEWVPLLPPNVDKERMKIVATEAWNQNPLLTQCDGRSQIGAFKKAAADGLLPDGREGVIVPFRQRQRDGSYRLVAQWNPMIAGLRKRARELENIIVSSGVVYSNDRFRFIDGDKPELIHEPAPLGTPRGDIIGAWAIFRQGDDILHRERMDVREIENTRESSMQPNSLMWTKFYSEACRKTVVRKGFKSVPCSARLEQIVRREDEAFDLEPERVVALPSPPTIEAEPEVELTPRPKGRPKGGRKRKAKPEAPAEPKAAVPAPAGFVPPKAEVMPPETGRAKKVREKVQPTVLNIRTHMFSAPNLATLQSVWDQEVVPYDWSEKDAAALLKTFVEQKAVKGQKE